MKMLKILIVEENPTVREVFKRLASSDFGAEVVAVSNATEGLAQAMSGQFDLIFSDNGMVGVDGPEMLCRLRAAGMGTPCVMFSDNWSMEAQIKAERYGARCLPKPFEKALLRSAVESLITLDQE